MQKNEIEMIQKVESILDQHLKNIKENGSDAENHRAFDLYYALGILQGLIKYQSGGSKP